MHGQGRACYPLALRLTNALDPIERSIIIDLAAISALVASGMALLEAGLADAEDATPDSDS